MNLTRLSRLVPLGVVVSLALVGFPTATRAVGAEPESYPLVCRGSVDLQPTVGEIAGSPSSANLRFKKGTRPASAGLAPGECSWLDRGLGESEPDRLTQNIWITYTAFENREKKTARWFEPIRDPATYWTFHVFNDGDGRFVVTDSRRYEEKLDGPIEKPGVAVDVAAAGATVETAARAAGETAASPDTLLVGPSMEPDTNRPGGDYRSFEPAEARPELCQEACARDPECKAYTYVKPGVQGPGAVCWLKSAVPVASPSDCCVSGVKGSA